ncbi:hypothetical protein HanRHA438_Chr02g0089871 [Helianthus annuus]|nr:hypothetical protein HanIR_Chr02g0091411 [Helianthus annuus]KAJ0941020.1 hypothetical protein HanRHA438_Chr02g0089871 [Helianthus annuus]
MYSICSCADVFKSSIVGGNADVANITAERKILTIVVWFTGWRRPRIGSANEPIPGIIFKISSSSASSHGDASR